MNYTFKFDTTGWTQDDINLIEAACIALLNTNQITYDKIFMVTTYAVEIDNASADPTKFLTQDALRSEIDSINASLAINNQQAKDYETQQANELSVNEFTNTTMDSAEAIVRTCKDIPSLTDCLAKWVRYVKAQE